MEFGKVQCLTISLFGNKKEIVCKSSVESMILLVKQILNSLTPRRSLVAPFTKISILF